MAWALFQIMSMLVLELISDELWSLSYKLWCHKTLSRSPFWGRRSSRAEVFFIENKVNSCFGRATHAEMFIDAANKHIRSMCLMMFRRPPHHSLNISLHNLWRSEEKSIKLPQEAAGGGWQPGSESPCRASRSSNRCLWLLRLNIDVSIFCSN